DQPGTEEWFHGSAVPGVEVRVHLEDHDGEDQEQHHIDTLHHEAPGGDACAGEEVGGAHQVAQDHGHRNELHGHPGVQRVFVHAPESPPPVQWGEEVLQPGRVCGRVWF